MGKRRIRGEDKVYCVIRWRCVVLGLGVKRERGCCTMHQVVQSAVVGCSWDMWIDD